MPKHSPFFLSFQFYDLLIQHGVFFLQNHVFVVVTEEPVAEPAPLPNLIEEVGQRVFLVKPSAEDVLNTGGAAVADDVVYLPADPIQICSGLLVFCFAGKFLRPPESVIHPEHGISFFELTEFLFELRVIRLQNTILNVMRGCPSHGEEPLSADVIDLAPHQVDEAGPNPLDLSTVPFLHRIDNMK